MAQSTEFSVTFSDALIEEASHILAKNYVRRVLTKPLRIAIVVNIVAFCVVAAICRNSEPTWIIAVIALVVPLYWPLLLVFMPPKIRKRLAENFQPSAQIDISDAGFRITAKQRSFALPWSDVLSITEYEHFILFVLKTRGAAVVVPSSTMPAAARTLITEVKSRGNSNAA